MVDCEPEIMEIGSCFTTMYHHSSGYNFYLLKTESKLFPTNCELS